MRRCSVCSLPRDPRRWADELLIECCVELLERAWEGKSTCPFSSVLPQLCPATKTSALGKPSPQHEERTVSRGGPPVLPGEPAPREASLATQKAGTPVAAKWANRQTKQPRGASFERKATRQGPGEQQGLVNAWEKRH
mmetsp:Transcript_104955/g.192532  ORF Transcript_104955/g.192532 Transcript_104955/m.192532 type:complete len:138 (+) Transcript_104955:729-1142(+)